MEEMIPVVLVVLVVLGVSLALAIWLIIRAVQAGQRIEELSLHIRELESEISRLKQERKPAQPAETAPPPQAKMATISPKPVSAPLPAPMISTPPRLEPATPRKTAPAINWEQFMGVKLFAWLGGLAFFLGIAFAIKYSFDHNLVSPELRMAFGFATGLGVLVGGVLLFRKQNYAVLSQTLCATGILILYAVTFACRSIYHFEFFGSIPTFLLMTLITVTAFLLAIQLNALVVAILGMLGGFLTPILLSTGQDNPLGLFGYIAILNAGLVAIALNRRWHFLTLLAAVGTVVMQISWLGEFFVAEHYFEGSKILTALGVLLGFNLLYLGAVGLAKYRKQSNIWLSSGTFTLAMVTFAFTAWFLTFAPLAQRPWLIFGFVFLVDLAVAALAWLDEKAAPLQPVAGLAVFGLLAVWTAKFLNNELLNAALAFCFIFAVFHSIFPVLLQRRRCATSLLWASQLFPLLALALMLVPIFQLAEVSFVIWPVILLVDVLAIVLAVLTAALLPVLAVLILTLAATGVLIFKIPSDLTGLPVPLFLIGAFATFFVIAGIWLVKKFKPDALKTGIKFSNNLAAPGDLAAILPAYSIVLPFLLLIMATLRLPLVNPSPVFGLALLLVVLLLGVTKLFSLDWMPAIGLVCVTALECAWHFNRFDPTNPNQPLNLVLTWYLIFFAAFALFPFLFLKQFSGKVVPWAAAAMSGPPQFLFVHRFVTAVYPNQIMGLLPAVFAIPALLSLVVVLKKIPMENKSRMTQLAWFGGVALFFITLIFPVQFERQWITIGWALEGAALLWLFQRVPHPGLRLTGVGLLVAAFIRLALNPAVLEYHPHAVTVIFNWYLYAYGIVTVCLFAGARLLAPPRNIVLESDVQPVLAGLGTVLAFLLLNIEIADYFSKPGLTLTFQFSGNFARDMTYSIAWALFALVLLVIGILRKIPATRYAAMGLLCVTLLKLFFHDLARLNQLYRIGAFIGVAVIAMLASFAYQRFFATSGEEIKPKNRTV